MFTTAPGLQALLNGLPHPIHVVDAKLVFQYVNEEFRAWGRRIGFCPSPEGLPLTEVFSFLPEETLAQYERVLQEGNIEKTEETTEFDSECYVTETSKIPLKEGDVVTHVVTIIRDVTNERKREQALREGEARIRGFAHALPDPVFVVDSEGVIHEILSACDNRLAMPREACLGKNLHDLFPPALAQTFMDGIQRTFVSGRGQIIEYELTFSNESRFFEGRTALLEETSSEGRRYVLWLAVDVTERCLAERERQRLESQLQRVQLLESLGTLAGGIAHDFNNILVGVVGNADLLMLEPGLPERAREFARIIKRAAERATELTAHMLAYAGKGRFIEGPVDMSLLVADTEPLLRVGIVQKVSLRLLLEPSLPPIRGDETQLRQVIMNLIINAAESCSDDSDSVTVRTRLVEADAELLSRSYVEDECPPGLYVALEVEDTGRGMDENSRSRLFEPFFTTKFSGRGLGLAAVLGIVRRHRGAIMVESNVGEGSSFTVLLPVEDREPQVGTRQVDHSRDYPPITKVATQKRILVVDDDEMVLEVTTGILRALGYQAVTASSGFQAVEILRADSNAVDAAMVDVAMPGMAGAQTVARIREHAPHVPIILSSGYDETDARRRWGDEAVSAFVQKPFEMASLEAILRRVLE